VNARVREVDDGPEVEAVAPPRSRAVLIASVAVGVVMILLVVLLLTSRRADEGASASPVLGKPAPAVAGEPLIGERFDIGTNDRWLVVNFFATWCVPCRQEHPQLRIIDEQLGADGTARVVSVAYDDQPEKVQQFFEEEGGDWPVLDSDNGRTALDWGVVKVPESFLVAPTGIVLERIQGGVVAADVEARIARYEALAAANAEAGS
jgi:cytochrome c biogenesis protein CcmG, thiol:disulfide interchange protein DsbE